MVKRSIYLVVFLFAFLMLLNPTMAWGCTKDSQCPSGQICYEKKCTKCTTTPPGALGCGGGAKNATCNFGQDKCECQNPTFWGNCDGEWSNGCEAALKTDINNCGKCGNKCAQGGACKNGVCQQPPGGGPPPPGPCNDITCGPDQPCSLSQPCGFKQQCVSGRCYCETGYRNCDRDISNGCEVNSLYDAFNCGSCGNMCSGVCDGGSCTTSSPPVSPPYPCQGKSCGSNAYCYGGSCRCSVGLLNCDGSWANGCECGGYNIACVNNRCGCAKGFTDCDGNAANGCEVGGACPPCKSGQTRTCNTTNICNGKQTCNADGYWESCTRTIAQICRPGATVSCSPLVGGKSCSTVSGIRTCNSCGNSYGSCVAGQDLKCCPQSTTSCSIGTCTGTKTCSANGQGYAGCVSGDITCCAQDIDCNDFNGCTTEKCISNKCEFLAIEDCRTLTPIKCKTDGNCASKDSCVEGVCVPLMCNDKFAIRDHKCVCDGIECGGQCFFTSGSCCGKYWNEDFETCEFDLGYYEERVNLSKDKEALDLLQEAQVLVGDGDIRKASIVAKIAITKAETVLSTESQQLKNSVLAILKEAKELLASGNYSLAIDKADEAMNLLENKGVATEIEQPSFWDENKVPVIAFSSVIAVLLVAIIYIIVTPKI